MSSKFFFFSAVGVTFVDGVERGEDDDRERGRVLERVDQVRNLLARVPVAAQALGEAQPRRKARDHRPDEHGLVHALAVISSSKPQRNRKSCQFLWYDNAV